MVSGRLQCIGSSQHLKSRFGAGYQLDVSFISEVNKQSFLDLLVTAPVTPATYDTTSEFLATPATPFLNAIVEEEHSNYARIKLPNEIDLAEAFTRLEELKREQIVFDYSLSQSTLEQIFINFAKHQEEEVKHKPE
jgi:hypothetical protein